MKFVVVDQCPVPSKAAPFVVEAKHRSGETLQSCYRGIEARAILAQFGKHDQTFLWNGWVRRLPGFNPANPPGKSTHECRNDGPAFPGVPVGGRIPEALVGQDWSNAFRVVAAYRAMGINAALTYPNSVRERQHINIRVVPKNLKPPLKQGDGRVKGHHVRERVSKMTGRLSYVATPHSGGKGRYLDGRRNIFDGETDKALKRFQRDHGLKPDGVYGEMSEHQLDLAYAHWYKKRHAAKPTPVKPPQHTGGTPAPSHPAPHPSKKTLRGVDVSQFQRDIDWKKAKAAGIDFPMVKATEGIDWIDPFCTPARVQAILDAGFEVFGFYHFARPQPGRSPWDEAAHFVQHVKRIGGLKSGRTLLALDIEWSQGLGTSQLRAWVKGFLDAVERQAGVRPILYTGAWFWVPRLGDPRTHFGTDFGRYPLWLAAYVKDPAPFVPKAWKRKGWTIWQHSDKGRVSGINGNVDVNVYHGSIHDLQRLAA